jgi:D-3-phosphoglycerate dehydrogenase / 2-oxoglutarate reductase
LVIRFAYLVVAVISQEVNMRVLIADQFEESGREGLAASGCDVVYRPGLKDARLLEEMNAVRPDVLVVRSTKVTEAMLEIESLKLVVRAGAGYNTIDVSAASKRGIYVSNCPGKNSIAVAELTFALILALDRRVVDNVLTMRAGKWNKSEFSKARGLFGRRLGILGTGSIAQEVIARAKTFGMPVTAWSRSLSVQKAREMGINYVSSPLKLAACSDIVSVHIALAKETRGLIGATFFEALHPGAYFINTSRGEVVNQAALEQAMHEKGIRVGLDVYDGEPASGKAELEGTIFKEPGLYGTHHIGASTEQAQEAIAAETIRIIRSFKERGEVPNAVNLARRTPATCVLAVRHYDRPGVLAAVLDTISSARINVQEMENIVFEGAEAAIAQIHLEREPSLETLQKLKESNANILELSLIPVVSR